jgi:hypothetical protein
MLCTTSSSGREGDLVGVGDRDGCESVMDQELDVHGSKKRMFFAPHAAIKRTRGARDTSTWVVDDRKYPVVMYAYTNSRRDSDKPSQWESENPDYRNMGTSGKHLIESKCC